MIKKLFLYLILLSIFSCNGNTDQTTNGSTENVAVKGSSQLSIPIPASKLANSIPELQAYFDDLKLSVKQPKPIQPMDKSAYDTQAKILVQNIVLNDPTFTRDLFHRETAAPLHSEITSIRTLTNEEVRKYNINAPASNCYKVEMYNYFYNMVVKAIVNLPARKVLGVNYFPAAAPELNKRTKSLASKIAIHYPEIAKELNTNVGELPKDYAVSVENSKCERSRHYCVAVVFEKENKKLWTIVDVNDWHVVGWQWITDEVEERPVVVTERTIQNEFVMEAYCNKENRLQQNDWDIAYVLTSSDGLEIKDVSFKGKPVINSAKLVDWHVSYTFNDGFGYSDAIGCPMYSSAAVVAFQGAEIEPISDGGFALIQDFRSPVWPLACNYRYQNRFEFYADGSFRITGVNLGIGCGAGGEYRPVFRIDLATGPSEFAQWDGSSWQDWTEEKWNLQEENTTYNPEGYLYRLSSAKGGYYIEPGNGQFNDGGRGDNAYTYITVKKDAEGKDDMPTFGECCNTNYEQGPETFMQPQESLDNKELIIWYVPQMYNDKEKGSEYCWAEVQVDAAGKAVFKTWQGVIGPKFIPIK